MNERTNHADENAGGALSPEDLELDDDHIMELAENRFLVTASEPSSAAMHGGIDRLPDVDPSLGTERRAATDGGSLATSESSIPTDVLANASARYGVDITVKTDDGIAREQLTSSDIREVFADVLRWYATQIDDELPAEETLGILLDASDLKV
jgi:hypothetical protein